MNRIRPAAALCGVTLLSLAAHADNLSATERMERFRSELRNESARLDRYAAPNEKDSGLTSAWARAYVNELEYRERAEAEERLSREAEAARQRAWAEAAEYNRRAAEQNRLYRIAEEARRREEDARYAREIAAKHRRIETLLAAAPGNALDAIEGAGRLGHYFLDGAYAAKHPDFAAKRFTALMNAGKLGRADAYLTAALVAESPADAGRALDALLAQPAAPAPTRALALCYAALREEGRLAPGENVRENAAGHLAFDPARFRENLRQTLIDGAYPALAVPAPTAANLRRAGSLYRRAYLEHRSRETTFALLTAASRGLIPLDPDVNEALWRELLPADPAPTDALGAIATARLALLRAETTGAPERPGNRFLGDKAVGYENLAACRAVARFALGAARDPEAAPAVRETGARYAATALTMMRFAPDFPEIEKTAQTVRDPFTPEQLRHAARGNNRTSLVRLDARLRLVRAIECGDFAAAPDVFGATEHDRATHFDALTYDLLEAPYQSDVGQLDRLVRRLEAGGWNPVRQIGYFRFKEAGLFSDADYTRREWVVEPVRIDPKESLAKLREHQQRQR